MRTRIGRALAVLAMLAFAVTAGAQEPAPAGSPPAAPGFAFRKLDGTVYFFNPGADDHFTVVSLGVSF